MKKTLLLLALIAGSLLSANAQELPANYLSAMVKPGANKQVAVRLNNTSDYTAFQMEVNLPEGLTFPEDAEPVLTTRQDESHQVHFNRLSETKMRVVVFSYKEGGESAVGNVAFGDGSTSSSPNPKTELLTIPVSVNVGDNTFAGATIGDVSLNDVWFVTEGDLNSDNLTVEFTGKLGDVTGDGILNTIDATRILKQTNDNLNGQFFKEAAADVNADGVINTTDATQILKETNR